MTDRTYSVYKYFNQPNAYLTKDFDIQLRSEIVKSIFGNLSDSRILDLGCGDGSVSLQYQSKSNHITLVDISENMLAVAKTKIKKQFTGNVKLTHSSIENFEANGKFDYILGIGIMAHVESIEFTINKISGLMKKSGKCILQITDSRRPLSKLLSVYNNLLDVYRKNIDYKRNQTSMKYIQDVSSKYALEIVKKHQFSLMLPGMIAFLPNNWLIKYHRYCYRNKVISQFGTDFLLELEKDLRINY